MEIYDEMVIGTRGKKDDGIEFHKIKDMIFCKNCGFPLKQVNSDEVVCLICRNKEFITGDFAATLAGYLKLDKDGTLKKYYDKVMNRKFSAVKMNNKRIIFQLLVKDKFIEYDDREMERLIQKIMWKKF